MAQPVRTTAPRQQQRAKATAPAQRQRTTRTKSTSTVRPFNMPFESKNVMFILIGIGIVTLGYVIMGMSETMGFMALSVSPVVLLLGYLIVIPMGIMYGAHRKKTVVVTEETTTVTE